MGDCLTGQSSYVPVYVYDIFKPEPELYFLWMGFTVQMLKVPKHLFSTNCWNQSKRQQRKVTGTKNPRTYVRELQFSETYIFSLLWSLGKLLFHNSQILLKDFNRTGSLLQFCESSVHSLSPIIQFLLLLLVDIFISTNKIEVWLWCYVSSTTESINSKKISILLGNYVK